MRNPITLATPGLRNLGLGCIAALLLTSTLSGCGNTASTDAVVQIDAQDVSWKLNDTPLGQAPSPARIGPALPILIHVFKSATDTTPIPGATVAVQVTGTGLTDFRLFDPTTGVRLDDGTGLFLTKTNDRGAILVDPDGLLNNCPPPRAGTTQKEVTFNANLSVAVYAAASAKIWDASITFKCVP